MDEMVCGCRFVDGVMMLPDDLCPEAAALDRVRSGFPWWWTRDLRAQASADLAEHWRRNEKRRPERAYFLNLPEVAGVALWYNARRQLHGEDPLPAGAHAVRIERHAAGINVVFRLPDTIEP